MTAKWKIFGLDETGPSQLQDHHSKALGVAKYIIADARFHEMLRAHCGTTPIHDWPKPFSELADILTALRSEEVVIFTTGDPLFYGAGATIKRLFPDQEIAIWPAVSGIAMAAARMGWQMTKLEIISIHGHPTDRPITKIMPYIYPRAKWLVIPRNASSLYEVSRTLSEAACGTAELTALVALGRDGEEQAITKTADEWLKAELSQISDFYVMAVDLTPCGRIAHYNAAGALPDAAFLSDGKLTKQDVRASALTKLQPHPHGVLWDLGTGCGSIAIEWARRYESCHAHGVDSRDDRLMRARANGEALGTPNVTWHVGDIIKAMDELPEPDAIFIGGGLSSRSLEKAYSKCPKGGRLVCHAVTLESEALLLEAHKHYGGSLTRLTIHKAEPVGAYHGWRGLMPVTQWVLVKEVLHDKG